MTSTALTVRSDASSAVVSANSISNGIRGVENAEFPIVCESKFSFSDAFFSGLFNLRFS